MLFDKMTGPKEENIDQIQMYLHYFKVPKGILLYVNKNNLSLKEYVVEYDKKRVVGLLKNLECTKNKIDTDVVPDRLDDFPDNWQCRYCPFKETCQMAGPGELEWEVFKMKNNLRQQGNGNA